MSDKSVLLAMDHNKERMRLIELEEDLEYNISRKEELKNEVRKLKDQYDSIYEVYFKNTKAAMDMNVENASLKAAIEKEKKENLKLQLENDKLKGRVESLEKENSKTKTASNSSSTPGLQDIESENSYLKEVIKSKEEDADKIFNELKDSNQNLKLQIGDLLQCNDCDKTFSDKAQIFNHIKSNHSVRNLSDFKCDNCGDEFANQSYIKDHMVKEHQVTGIEGNKYKSSNKTSKLKNNIEKHKITGHITSSKESILKRQAELLNHITTQKINIVNLVYKLKQKEEEQIKHCSCRGFCRVLHSRFRWKLSQSNDLFRKFEAIHGSNSSVECKICDKQFSDEEVFKNHEKRNHQPSAEYESNKCDEHFSKENEMGKPLESFHASENFNCPECEQTFASEESLKVHAEKVHQKCPLNSTFFNPSASQ